MVHWWVLVHFHHTHELTLMNGLACSQNWQHLAHHQVHNCHSFYENYTLHPKLLRVNCSFKCMRLAYEDISRSSKLVCKPFPNYVWQNLSWVCQITSDLMFSHQTQLAATDHSIWSSLSPLDNTYQLHHEWTMLLLLPSLTSWAQDNGGW